ncbi:MAG: FtsX-like permease family protein [Alphaproteobacteria bacterium]|nr:FtsX-like permease family protein [Alphaproteobacteria bacterium]
MSIIFKKSMRDIQQRFRSTLLAILALTIGIWGGGSLLVSFYIMSNDLSANYLLTKPYQLSIQSKDFAKLDLDNLHELPEIAAAEFRDRAILRIEVKPDEWLPLWLYSVEDFDQLSIAKFYPQAGQFPPAKGTIAIERNNLLISQLNVDSVARAQSNGKLIDVKISGIIFDPGQAPSTQDAFIYAYTDEANYTRLSGKATHQKLIIRFNNVKTQQDVKQAYAKLAIQFAAQGIKIEASNIPKFDQHPHQFQLNTILMINGSISFLTFIMSMVLISQLMNSIFTRQTRQIGIMKAIGAKRGHILRIYLTYLLSISAVSIAIGLPLAVLTGKKYSDFIASVLNFDILTTDLPYFIFAIVIVLGFILPVIFSLPMLRNAVHISVNNALADYGIEAGNNASSSRKTSSMGMNIYSLAWRNLARRKGRMLVTMLTMALGVGIFLTGFNVRESLSQFLTNSSNSMQYDLKVVLKNTVPPETASAPFNDIAAISSIEGWLDGVGRVQTDAIATANSIGLVAMPYDNTLNKHDFLQGTWLTGAEQLEFVINQQAASEFAPIVIGQQYTISIAGQDISARLVGMVREFDVAKIYIDIDKYRQIAKLDDEINSLMMVLNDRSYDNVLRVKKQVERVIANQGIEVVYIISEVEYTKIVFDHLNIILTALLILSLLVLSVSAMGMGSAMGINVMERTREIGVLRAIGATPKMVIRLFVMEGFMVSALSVLLGILLALPLSAYGAKFFGNLILGENTPLDFTFSFMGFAITLIVTLAFGYIASRLPASKAIKISVREAIAYE